MLAEYDGNGDLNYNYIYGNGRKLARKDGSGTVNYLHSDYLGSLRVNTNSSGTAIWNRNFRSPDFIGTEIRLLIDYPFGEEMYAYSTGNDYKFSGKEWNSESALYYSWHRYYDPEIGRFTQVDPLWMEYPSLTSYQYCDNNPLINTDPDGEFIQILVGAAVGAALEAGSQIVESMSTGQTFSETCGSIDKSDVLIAAGAGAATGGLSAVKAVSTAAKIAKVGLSVATNIGEGASKAKTGSSTEQYGVGGAAIDAGLSVVGEFGGALGKKIAQNSNTQTFKTLKNDARKATNIAATGRPRPTQTAKAITAQKKVNNYGSGGIATSANQTAQSTAKTIINTEKSKKD